MGSRCTRLDLPLAGRLVGPIKQIADLVGGALPSNPALDSADAGRPLAQRAEARASVEVAHRCSNADLVSLNGSFLVSANHGPRKSLQFLGLGGVYAPRPHEMDE